MSLTEIGVYTMLLCHAWLDNGLPTDVAQIARLVKLPVPRFTKMWNGALSECFVEHDGRLVNVRLEEERDKQANYRSRQAGNGALGGRPKKNPWVSETEPKGDGDSKDLSLVEKKEIEFEAFWLAYPRKDGKQAARAEWNRLSLDAEAQLQIASDLERRCRSAQWQKDGGQFIPHARTYLHQKRWLDGFEGPAPAPTVSQAVADPVSAWLSQKVVGS